MEHALNLCIVGAGRLGSALATQLQKSYDCVDTIVARPSSIARALALAERIDATAVELQKAHFDESVIWLCIPDTSLAKAGKELAQRRDWRGKIVFHSSGALSSDELEPLRAKGAAVASVHPMMTFAADTVPQLAGVLFALEGDHRALEAARRLVGALHGNDFVITKDKKALYHAFGTFISPLILTALTTAEQVGISAGIPERLIRPAMQRIVLQQVDNYFKFGPQNSFTGPLMRGDVDTIRMHLKALEGPQREAYVGLAKAALQYLPVQNAEDMRKLFNGKEGK